MKQRLKKTKEKVNETKSWFFENVNKIEMPLAKIVKKKERIKICKTRNEKEVTTDTTEKTNYSDTTTKTYLPIKGTT